MRDIELQRWWCRDGEVSIWRLSADLLIPDCHRMNIEFPYLWPREYEPIGSRNSGGLILQWYNHSENSDRLIIVIITTIRYRNYGHYPLYRSCLPIFGIAIIRSLSFLFLEEFEENANISVAIKSSSTGAKWWWKAHWSSDPGILNKSPLYRSTSDMSVTLSFEVRHLYHVSHNVTSKLCTYVHMYVRTYVRMYVYSLQH